ncbi:hypothetical protein ES707_22145 [subsurface metagenome]
MFHRLENTNGNHNKFYQMHGFIYVDKKTGEPTLINLTIHYGRIGTIGRTIFKEFTSKFDLFEFVKKKLKEKLNRGYILT